MCVCVCEQADLQACLYDRKFEKQPQEKEKKDKTAEGSAF